MMDDIMKVPIADDVITMPKIEIFTSDDVTSLDEIELMSPLRRKKYRAIKTGHWIPDLIPTGVSAFGVDEMTAESEHCSECGKDFWIGEKKNYCPNCGAKMDGERKEE